MIQARKVQKRGCQHDAWGRNQPARAASHLCGSDSFLNHLENGPMTAFQYPSQKVGLRVQCLGEGEGSWQRHRAHPGLWPRKPQALGPLAQGSWWGRQGQDGRRGRAPCQTPRCGSWPGWQPPHCVEGCPGGRRADLLRCHCHWPQETRSGSWALILQNPGWS